MSEPLKSPRVLILGATSKIGEEVARLYAEDGARLILAARNGDALSEISADLVARGARDVATIALDLADDTACAAQFSAITQRYDGLDAALILYAHFEDQHALEREPERAKTVLQTDLVSLSVWAIHAANYFEQQRSGVLAAAGALAGDRGRRSNYVYGAAKAGVATLMQGIAHRLHDSGARAHVFKIGPVASPMTRGQTGCADAGQVARAIKRVLTHGGPAAVYMPWWWRMAMWPIRMAPDFVMHRTRL